MGVTTIYNCDNTACNKVMKTAVGEMTIRVSIEENLGIGRTHAGGEYCSVQCAIESLQDLYDLGVRRSM